MLYTIETNGTNYHVISCDTNGIGSIGNAAWSPDGNKIAFVAGGLTGKIYLMNPDGTGIEFLTEGLTPCWNSDGENIVYVYKKNSSSFSDIYNIHLSDKMIQKIAVLDIDQDYNWLGFDCLSPDNKELLFHFGSTWSYNSHIGVWNIEGNNSRQLTEGYDVFNKSPCWSADSKKILYFCEDELCAMNADGSDKAILKLPEELKSAEKTGLTWYNGSLSW
jgi:Tol biopolymer transport system component